MLTEEIAVRALVCSSDCILVAHIIDNDSFCFLPGGRLEQGESLIAGLRREVNEELSVDFTEYCYLGVIDASWNNERGKYLSRQHFFQLSGTALESKITPSNNLSDNIGFKWLAVGDLVQSNLKPAGLAELILHSLSTDQTCWYKEVRE